MSEHVIISLGSILVIGIGAQWLAWRLRFPSIVFLMVFGFIAGPVTGVLHPDQLMGDLLFPLVSISVAIILFEGGMTLRLDELRSIGKVVMLLVSIGAIITWITTTLAAIYILKLQWEIAVLLGAILVVTGPTVIGPLLRHIRPTEKVADILKWEGIVIDPIGAILAVLVFEAIIAGEAYQAVTVILLSIFKTVVFGGLIGLAFAGLSIFLLRKFWLPDHLQVPTILTFVVASFIISNMVQEESGLLAATLMGVVMDNQKIVSVKHIVEFKENLRVLIISILFILLSARLQLTDILDFTTNKLFFIGVLVLFARPIAVFISTLRTDLNIREKLFISWMAPRGIVAAAVSSIFAFKLADIGLPGTEFLVPITFLVIVSTVVLYGLTSSPIARLLKVAQSNPQGILFIGAPAWSRAMAKELQRNGFKVAMIDTNRSDVKKACKSGIPAYFESVLSEDIFEIIPLDGIGRLVALTPNDEVNSLAVLHFDEIFERNELYQLPSITEENGTEKDLPPLHLRGRFLFRKDLHFSSINHRFFSGATIKSIQLKKEFDYKNFREYYGDNAIPLFLIQKDKDLMVFTTDKVLEPDPEDVIIALVDSVNKDNLLQN